jgi:hypothetical protein
MEQTFDEGQGSCRDVEPMMMMRAFTVCKCVKEQYPISEEHSGAREHQAENPCCVPRCNTAILYLNQMPRPQQCINYNEYHFSSTEISRKLCHLLQQLVSYFCKVVTLTK